jgi:hypothetical protein
MNKNWIIFPALALVIVSCKPNSSTKSVQARLNSGETPSQIVSGGIPTDSLYGKTYQGGFIFLWDQATSTGYVAAPSDQSSGAEWGCMGMDINGAGIDSGDPATDSIMAQCATSGIAARLCGDLVAGGHSDWILPNYMHLYEMRQKLKDENIGSFSTGFYWASEQGLSDPANLANVLSFNDQSGSLYHSKNQLNYVRAVRKIN